MILAVTDNAATPTGVVIETDTDATVAYCQHEGIGTLATATVSVIANTPTPLSLIPGVYSFFAVDASNPLNLSWFIHRLVTTGNTAVATRIRAEIVRRFTLLGLPVMIAEQWNKTDESQLTFPCVLLTVEDATETREDTFATQTQDWGRPIVVAIMDNVDQYDQESLPDWESWRQSLMRAVNNQQLPLPESVISTVEPGLIADPLLPRWQRLISGFVIRNRTREPDGLGA